MAIISGLPRLDPRDAGFSAERLSRMNGHFGRLVDDEKLAGWHISVNRGGHNVFDSTYGMADIEAARPVADDTIWRIYSMSKPITAIAALMLWEEGAFELKDPVSNFIPEFADTKVWRAGSETNPQLEPITEVMQLWHLFSHTAGLTYGFMFAHPVDAIYRKSGMEWGWPKGKNLEEVCQQLASLPLVFQPGTEWNYSTSIDVLGRVVEVASGTRLRDFMQERIFDPLGMTDTEWFVDESKAERLAGLYGKLPGVDKAVRLGTAGQGALHEPPGEFGGGGLVSTMADYVRFAEFLRRGGEVDGNHLLSPRTIELMATNHLPNNSDLTDFGRPLASETAYDGVGFGLGVSVTIDPVKAKVPGSVGDFGWGGAASTWFMVDPVEDITAVFMTQLMPSSTYPIRSQFKTFLHQALVD
ncbi:MAG: beta-lactamase family protein [Actinobacteria bacterium]|nr:beta-lactamase family protein [Actinomycetota bacterium]